MVSPLRFNTVGKIEVKAVKEEIKGIGGIGGIGEIEGEEVIVEVE